MANAGWIHGAAGMALGALAAWGAEIGLGIGRSLPGLPVLAVLLGAGCLAAYGSRRPRRMAMASPGPAFSPAGRGTEAEGAALLGHEMKNYLCTLKGNARLLRQRMPTGDQAIIDRIDRVVEKLESFTRGLGDGDAATGLKALASVPPAQAARACARMHFPRRSGAFRFSEEPAVPALLCDSDRLEQVFLNLYANAFEAGAGRVDTAVRREGDRLLVRIEDDGRGCAREDLERIFEPFFTTKPGPARRGLGMFIVRSIVENHGGRIRVATKNGSEGGRTGLIITLDFPSPDDGDGPARIAVRSALPDWSEVGGSAIPKDRAGSPIGLGP